MQLVSLTVHVNSDKSVVLEQGHVIFEYLIQEIFDTKLPCSFIAEPSTQGFEYLIEVHAFKDESKTFELRYRNDDDFTYTIVDSQHNGKFVFVSGISEYYKDGDVTQSSRDAFKRMNTILKYENMTAAHIFRQWNYIEGIIQTKDENGILSQNYQDFNDIRAQYYNKVDFKNGYPAATGIGTKTGGLNISFYAYSGPGSIKIQSVVNPLQTEAFDYSEKVLVGGKLQDDYCKAAPKFDRAKYLGVNNEEYIFISGTAAIRGEETLAINNAKEQTDITIQNMLELLKHDNLQNSEKESISNKFKLLYIKVYVKVLEDKKDIEEVCNHYFPKIPKAYVIADVCRENLLVEIEGIAQSYN